MRDIMSELFQLSGKSLVLWLCIGYFIYAIYCLWRYFTRNDDSAANQDLTQIIVLLITCVVIFLSAMGIIDITRDEYLIGLVVLYFLIITGRSIYRLIKGEAYNKKRIITSWLITFALASSFVSHLIFYK